MLVLDAAPQMDTNMAAAIRADGTLVGLWRDHHLNSTSPRCPLPPWPAHAPAVVTTTPPLITYRGFIASVARAGMRALQGALESQKKKNYPLCTRTGTGVDFPIPVVVTALTDEEMEAILNNPTVLKEKGMSPDEALLKYMAAGSSVGASEGSLAGSLQESMQSR